MLPLSVIRCLLCLFAVFAASGKLNAQNDFIDNFNIEAHEGKAYLRWTVSAGNTCDGIEIQRSTNATNYARIGEIYGVCGSEDSAQKFEYTDNMPETDRTNFYRLLFGSSGKTAAQSVFVLSEDGFALYPNPARNTTRIYLRNSANTAATLNIFDISGRLILHIPTKSNIIDIDCNNWPSGMYIYSLAHPGKLINGKLMVIH
jgi:hypothetical protein